ncbi:MAG: tRNA 2-thiouridine(34) synthase MnmA, partial [Actinomycetota bacterium]|nr:tRNA 2-thiouridine(34) synthase MnmA [Actinomycetota bacterium]
LYALRTDPSANAVVVGPRDSLARTVVDVRTGCLYVPVAQAEAKLRYRSDPHRATVIPLDGGFRLDLAEPAYGVAPGQAAVLYEDDVVVGAGVVSAAR